jgi:branched-chain amino acid transport system permease protein
VADFAQVLANGLIAGSIYALIAVGYTMVYGVLKFINFAHGDVAMLGAYLAFFFLGTGVAQAPKLALAAVAAAVACAVLGIVIERFAYRPLRTAPRLTPLITAIGISVLLEAVATLVWGAQFRQYALPDWPVVELAGARVTVADIAIGAVALVSLLALSWLLGRTPVGADIRAVADNLELAESLGIDVDRTISVVFALGSFLAAIAGVLIGMEVNLIPVMGFDLGIKAFAAVVLGGIGSVPGAVLGAYAIGLAENGAAYVLGGVWKDAIAYAVMIAVLLVRPSGLLGATRESEVKL